MSNHFPQSTNPNDPAQGVIDLCHIRFLVVDDQRSVCALIVGILKNGGAKQTVSVHDGRDAFTLLKKTYDAVHNHDLHLGTPFNFIICDYNMPELNGLELLEKIRTSDEFRDLPFLMVTAESHREFVENTIHKGVDGFLIKPFTAKSFTDKIHEILSKKQLLK